MTEPLDPTDSRSGPPSCSTTLTGLPPLPTSVRLPSGALFHVTGDGRWRMPGGSESLLTTDLLARPYVDPRRPFSLQPGARGPVLSPVPTDVVPWAAAIARRQDIAEKTEQRDSVLNADLVHLARLYILDLARRLAPATLKGIVSTFLYFERWLGDAGLWTGGAGSFGISDLTVQRYDLFRRHCHRRLLSRGDRPIRVRAFYRWGVDQGLPGFELHILKAIRGLKLKRGTRGEAIRLKDPRVGALNRREQEQVLVRLEEGVGTLSQRVIVDLFRQTGIRPKAVVALSFHDLIQRPQSDVTRFQLRVPRVKQPGAGGVAVDGRPPLTITNGLGEAILLLHSGVTPNDNSALVPTIHIRADGTTRRHKTTFVRHLCKSWGKRARLLTARIPPQRATPEQIAAGEPYPLRRMPLTPIRFRRTMASTLAEQGHPPEVIAAALDDRTLAMALTYVENNASTTDDLADTLDRHPEWRRVLRLFLGEIANDVDKHFPPVWGGAWWLPNADEYADVGIIGYCKSILPCEYRPPISCYICMQFRAEREGDHARQREQVRDASSVWRGREGDRTATALRRTDDAMTQLMLSLERKRALPERLTSVAGRIRALSRPRSTRLNSYPGTASTSAEALGSLSAD
jgi:hypothetical protein